MYPCDVRHQARKLSQNYRSIKGKSIPVMYQYSTKLANYHGIMDPFSTLKTLKTLWKNAKLSIQAYDFSDFSTMFASVG